MQMYADMLFKFQWLIEKHQFNALDLGPGFVKQPREASVSSI